MVGRRGITAFQRNIAFFGSFYPRIDRLATTSTGMVYLMSKCQDIEGITVLGPIGSKIPGNYPPNVKIEPLWEYDDIPSLIRTLFLLLRKGKKFDLIFFNLILTSFGRRKLSNAFGLLIPPLLSILAHKKPVVYIHNLVETQDIRKLGYGNAHVSKLFARVLERLLFGTTNIILPLESQRKTIERIYGTRVDQALFVGVEGIWTLKNYIRVNNRSTLYNLGKIRILLFGAWGPQKDIVSILRMLKTLTLRVTNFHVIVAGSINKNFPEYRKKLSRTFMELDPGRFSFIENPEEESVPELFINSDILILPYNAAGGYSAVMNVARLYCIKILAYDIEELREIARTIDVNVDFIPRDNNESLEKAIRYFLWEPKLRGADSELAELIACGEDRMTGIIEKFSKYGEGRKDRREDE